MNPATRVMDLNADLGEDVGNDAALLELVTSANIACGAHAGDPATMRRTCALAAERGVVIGAHPGYDDRAYFGRRDLDVSAPALAKSLGAQYMAIAGAARAAGATVRYVKPHGALYHRAARDRAIAASVLAEAVSVAPALAFLAPPGSILLEQVMGAGPGVRGVVEGFADRAYGLDEAGRPVLLPRDAPGALLGHDAAVAQALALATAGVVRMADGTAVPVHPESICVHGDTPGAVALARDIRAELTQAGVHVRAFVA